MQVKSIAESSKGSIVQYFRPSLSYHLLLRPLFCLFLSGPLRQVLQVLNGEERAGSFALFVFLMSRDWCVAVPHNATGLSAVCDCGIS